MLFFHKLAGVLSADFAAMKKGNMLTIVRYFLIILILYGVAARLYQFGGLPGSLYVDEVSIAAEARALADTGVDLHGESWFKPIFYAYGDYKLAVYIWFAAISTKLFGVSQFAVRLPSLLAGLGTIMVGFFFVKELVQQKIIAAPKQSHLGLAFMAVLAVSPTFIMFSRTGFEGHLAQFFLNLSLLFFLKSNKGLKFAALSGSFGALSVYTYFANRFVWPAALVACAFFMLPALNIKYVKNAALKIVLAFVVFAALLIPMSQSMYYEANNTIRYSADSVLNNMDEYVLQSNMAREMAGERSIDRIIFHRYRYLLQDLLSNFSQNLSLQTLFLQADQNLRHSTAQHGLFLFVFLPFFLLGIAQLKNNWRLALGLSVWVLFAALPASVPLDVPHSLRSLNVVFPLGLIVAVGFSSALEHTKPSSGKLLQIFILFVVLLQIGSFSYYYFTAYQHTAQNAWAGREKHAIVSALSHTQSSEDIFIVALSDKYHLWVLSYAYLNEPYRSLSIEKNGRDFLSVNAVHLRYTVQQAATNLIDKKSVVVVGRPTKVLAFVGEINTVVEQEVEITPLDAISETTVVQRVSLQTN